MITSDTAGAVQGALDDDYELLEQLGRGGFGTVFKALQKSTGQLVAVKLPSPGTSAEQTDPILLRRFEREVRLCASLNHPNIVRILGQGRRGKDAFIVFELVPGETLTDLLARRGALPAIEAVPIMAQVLEALDGAHTRGVVHRDLKPDNLMITSTGTQRHVKVVDFGVGAFTESVRGAMPPLTGSHEVLGTPSYCAPEQLRGEPATTRSDLYSWGLVLLECLTGRRVMEGSTAAEVFYRQLSWQEIPLPKALATHALGDILRRVLAKAPRERAADARKLWSDLRRVHIADLVMDLTPGGALSSTDTVRVDGWRSGGKHQATIFCCSLNATSAGARELDVETLDAVQRDQLSLCTDVISRFGGRVLGRIGDRLLAVFGVPEVSDSDARRAAHAALELTARVRARRAAMLVQRGIDLELRVAVHTGIVLIDIDGNPSGPALGVAARLEAIAPPGSAVASETTRKLLARHLRFQALEAGGRSASDREPAGHLIVAERPGGSDGGVRAELVGREVEKTRLLQLWNQARTGTGQVVIVRGEAGIGKSRLVHEIRRRVFEDGGDSIECQCLPEDNYTALNPILSAIRQRFDLDGAEPRGGLAAMESALAARGLEVAESIAILGPWLALPQAADQLPSLLSPERQREALIDVLLRLLSPVPGEDSRLLLIEDLHWSDPTTRELVVRLGDRVNAQRLLVILTSRIELERPPAGCQDIELQGLDRAAVERLIASQADGAPMPAEMVREIIARTDGIPIFVEELTRSLLDLQPRGQGASRLVDGAVPASLRDLLNGRLSHLGPAKETAQLAAAIGREFDVELLELVSARGSEAVRADLDRLVEARLLQQIWSATGNRFAFRHALIREAAWESMLAAQRRGAHRMIAETIEGRFVEQARAEPARLARHYELASVPDKAAELRLRAAQQAIQGSAYREAREHLDAGLAVLELIEDSSVRHQQELELRNTLGGLLLATQGFASDEVMSTFSRSHELLALANPSPVQQLTTLKGLWMFHNARANYETAQQMVRRLMDLAAANDRPEFHLTAHAAAAETSFLVGRFQEAVAQSTMNDRWFNLERQGNQIARYGIDPWLSAVTGECISAVMLGRVKHARGRLALAFSVCEKLNSATHEAGLLAQAGAVEMFLGTAGPRPNAATAASLEYNLRAIAIAERYGLRFNEAYARLVSAMVGAAAGEEVAIADLQRSIAIWRAMGVRAASSWHLAFVARGQHLRREYADATANARAALDHCAVAGEGYGASECHRVLSALLGDPENPACDPAAAASHGWLALEVASQQEARWLELQAAMQLAATQSGAERERARAALADVLAWFVREQEGLDLSLLQSAQVMMG